MCDFYCNDYGNTPSDPTKYISALITTNKPLGYGEYAVWIKNSTMDGVISCFYLSKMFTTDENGNITSNGQIELDWEVTPDPDNRSNQLICDSNIYAYDSSNTRCDSVPTCQQPHDFILSYTGGFPSSSTNYDGAIQYIIGVYREKIEFKLVDSSYKLMYLRVIDKMAKTDIATFYDGSTPQKIFSDTNFDAINKLYTDETTLYPFINMWTPPDNWLTTFANKGNLLYNPSLVTEDGQCNNCQSNKVPQKPGDTGYAIINGATTFVFGTFTFTPSSDNKIFKPSDWFAVESTSN